MRALVVGLNWGHVHINAIRELGHTVAGVVDTDFEKSKAVANQYSIEHYYSSLKDVSCNDFDFITIAVPARYHFDVITQALKFNKPIICEKPVLGIDGTEEQFSAIKGDIYFNFAYPFMQDVDIFYKKLENIENIRKIKIICSHNLKLTTDFSDEEMFFETVIHPVALISHKLFNKDSIRKVQKISKDTLEVLLNNNCSVEITCVKDTSIQGIKHTVSVVSDKDSLILTGEYVTGKTWHYKPVIFNKDYVSIEHWRNACPWYTANKNSIANLIALFKGEISQERALLNGAFSLDKALIIERLLAFIKQ